MKVTSENSQYSTEKATGNLQSGQIIIDHYHFGTLSSNFQTEDKHR